MTPFAEIGGVAAPSEDHRKLEVLQLQAKAKLVSEYEVLDVEGAVAWSRMFPNLEILWIVAPHFIDDSSEEVFDGVIYNIKDRGVTVQYFVSERDIEPRGRFAEVQSKLMKRLGRKLLDDNVIPVGLNDEQVKRLQSDFVVANPHRRETFGLQYLRRRGLPSIAVSMDPVGLHDLIKAFEDEAKKNPKLAEKWNRPPLRLVS